MENKVVTSNRKDTNKTISPYFVKYKNCFTANCFKNKEFIYLNVKCFELKT